MNDNNLNYFSDLKFFLNYILKNYIFLMIILIISMIAGYAVYEYDKSKVRLSFKSQLTLNKNLSNKYDLHHKNYIQSIQTEPITSYFDLYDLIFDITKNEYINYLDNKEVKYELSFGQKNNINIILTNYEITDSDINNINKEIKLILNTYINDYKKLEFDKLNTSLSNFLLEIYIKKNIKLSLNYGNFQNSNNYGNFQKNSNNKEKIEILKKAFDELYQQGITNMPDGILQDYLFEDSVYKKLFLDSIGFYFYELCNDQEYFNKNLNFCSINDNFLEYKKFNVENKKCDVSSQIYGFEKMILTIVENKIICDGGFKISNNEIYEPLDLFLQNIQFPENLFTYKILKLKNDKNPSIIMYQLYSIVFGFFIFLLLSLFYAIFKSR